MSRYRAYIRNAANLLEEYDGSLPLALYLKKYFGLHKKFGSKDRREITALCYQFFRLGHTTDQLTMEDALLAADFVIRGKQSDIIINIKSEWLTAEQPPIDQRIQMAGLSWALEKHTPWLPLLAKEMSPENYVWSHFYQPDLFLRIRPGRKKNVVNALQKEGVLLEEPENDCLRLSNGIPLDAMVRINRDVVIQDFSSQQCGTEIKNFLPDLKGVLWDACAASGGKSIMMHDLYSGHLRIVASDIRTTILHNLKKRYEEAGVPLDNVFICDLTKPLPNKNFWVDVALVDAPCTGSGTWSRTPEQHYFFKPETVNEFAERQFEICKHVLEHVKPGGYIIYITCSVFTDENQAVTKRLVSELPVKLLHEKMLDGTLQKADSMYISIVRRTD